MANKKVEDWEIIEDLTTNLENSETYLNISDLAKKYDMAKQSVRHRLKRLEERGEIKHSETKSKIKSSTILNKSKVYIPTTEGLENYGVSRPESGQNSEGPDSTPLEFHNIHGLEIQFKVRHRPDPDPLEWDKTVELNNGVTQKVKKITKDSGEKLTIQLFEGEDNATLTIKPKLLAKDSETVEELKEKCDQMAHEIRRSLEREDGYKLGLGEKKDSGTKYTIRSEALEDLGYVEAGNFSIDRSEGTEEIHPETGSDKGDKALSKILDGSTLEDLEEKSKLELLEEAGEIGELFTEIEKNREIQRQTIRGVKKIAQQQGQLAQSFNELLEEIKGPAQEQIDRGKPQGGMYG